MDEEKIAQVAAVLSEWNPLGDRAQEVEELDGYRTEAIDIIFEIDLRSARSVEAISRSIRQILNQAFDMSLYDAECKEPASLIMQILSTKQ